MSTNSVKAVDVLEAVHALMHAFRSRQYAAQEVEPLALTHLDGKVLGIIGRAGQLRQSELIAQLGRDKGQVARMIAGLCERGLLAREVDEEDRRAVLLSLTAPGRNAMAALALQLENVANLACGNLGPAEMRKLVEVLGDMKARLARPPARRAEAAPPGSPAPSKQGRR